MEPKISGGGLRDRVQASMILTYMGTYIDVE